MFNGNCIKNCEIGELEKCYDCKTENGTNDQCLHCNDGYYFDINYNKGICKKIDIDNCAKVLVESNNITCVNCSFG